MPDDPRAPRVLKVNCCFYIQNFVAVSRRQTQTANSIREVVRRIKRIGYQRDAVKKSWKKFLEKDHTGNNQASLVFNQGDLLSVGLFKKSRNSPSIGLGRPGESAFV